VSQLVKGQAYRRLCPSKGHKRLQACTLALGPAHRRSGRGASHRSPKHEHRDEGETGVDTRARVARGGAHSLAMGGSCRRS